MNARFTFTRRKHPARRHHARSLVIMGMCGNDRFGNSDAVDRSGLPPIHCCH